MCALTSVALTTPMAFHTGASELAEKRSAGVPHNLLATIKYIIYGHYKKINLGLIIL